MTRFPGLTTLAIFVFAGVVTAFEPDTTRQMAAIYVKVEGRTHSVFFDFPATRAAELTDLNVRTTFNADLPLWIEGEKIEPGEHEWYFRVEAPDMWTIGPPDRSKKDPAPRYRFSLRNTDRPRDWMAAWLTPDPVRESVLLTVALGPREGTLRFQVSEAAAESARTTTVDRRELERIRDELRAIAAELRELRTRRHLWSSVFRAIGDEILAGEGGGWVSGVDFSREQEWVRLAIRGRLPGERSAATELNERLKKGRLGDVFPIFRLPRSGMSEGGTRGFTLSAEIAAPDWRKVKPIAVLKPAADEKALLEEVLFLETRIASLAPATVQELKQGRMLLLDVKRKAGALLSDIKPGDAATDDSGLTRFEIRLRIGGSAASIVEFLRAVEERPEPVRIIPVSLQSTKFGPELSLKLIFVSSDPLSQREPDLWSALVRGKEHPGYAERVKAYLDGRNALRARPYKMPEWSRDPFMEPREAE